MKRQVVIDDMGRVRARTTYGGLMLAMWSLRSLEDYRPDLDMQTRLAWWDGLPWLEDVYPQ